MRIETALETFRRYIDPSENRLPNRTISKYSEFAAGEYHATGSDLRHSRKWLTYLRSLADEKEDIKDVHARWTFDSIRWIAGRYLSSNRNIPYQAILNCYGEWLTVQHTVPSKQRLHGSSTSMGQRRHTFTERKHFAPGCGC